MEALVGHHSYADVMHHKISTLTPEHQFPPFLARLFLQENNSPTMISPSLSQNMPLLRVVDLSHTNIQSLPPSISKLCSLEEFILRDCSLLIELPPEIGALKNLKLFDLEGTEIMYLPKEIGKLRSLELLRVSLSTYADEHEDKNGIQHIIPRMTISKLTKLKELSINVSPEAEWWEVELLEAILGDLLFLPDLKTLELYLPTAKALQQFLRLKRYKVPIYSSLCNYRFMAGHCEELPLSVQLDVEENFLKLEKCVKYMNGEGYTDEIAELVRDARALYLRRHWTIEKLSMFDIRRLKYCLLMECNEMQTLVDQEDIRTFTSDSEDGILGSLQYLSIHFMKKLQSISKGPIGRNNLSCLRILALHTCPELTSVFTESLLDNLQSLTEIIVEDCPKVKCLVKLEEVTPWSNGPFFPNLRRVSLLDLPELVSVSGGVRIAPQLDTLLVFNCMKLDYLSVMEIPRDTMAVKGEIEWWDALKYGKLTWESVFVQLKRDGSLMDQLAEDTNSLQHFLELEMGPSLSGSSLDANQNSSKDTMEDTNHVNQLQNFKRLNFKCQSTLNITSRHQVKENKDTEVGKALDDGYIWRKYGVKSTLGSVYPREYYRCSFGSTNGCPARKHVQKTTEDPSIFAVSYSGNHTCPTVLSNNSSSIATSACTTLTSESASVITESHFELAKSPQVLTSHETKSISTRDAKWTKQLKISRDTGFDLPPNDGYHWRKHGQHDVLEATYPIHYYRCNSCDAKISVQRSDADPYITIVTYKGIHTCLSLLASDSTRESKSALSILKSSDSSITVESKLRVLKNRSSSTTAESTPTVTDNSSGLNFTKRMSGNSSIQRWKQQAEKIQSPSLKFQLPSSSYEPNVIMSEVEVNDGWNLSLSAKTPPNAKQCPSPVLKERKDKMSDKNSKLQKLVSPFGKERKEKLGGKITKLQQLVSPFGKTDTASVLSEASHYIKFLHEQVKVLSTPYVRQGTSLEPNKQAPNQDLKSKGLCLMPLSSSFAVPPDETNECETQDLFPHPGSYKKYSIGS